DPARSVSGADSAPSPSPIVAALPRKTRGDRGPAIRLGDPRSEGFPRPERESRTSWLSPVRGSALPQFAIPASEGRASRPGPGRPLVLSSSTSGAPACCGGRYHVPPTGLLLRLVGG